MDCMELTVLLCRGPFKPLSPCVCFPDVNECESAPCLNGGVCTDLEANYTCVCSGEFSGLNCQHSECLVSCRHLPSDSSLSGCRHLFTEPVNVFFSFFFSAHIVVSLALFVVCEV